MEPSGVSSFPSPSPSSSLLGRVRRFAAVASITIVAACQAPAATPTSSASGAASLAPASVAPSSPSASASSTGLSGLFHVVGSAPVIPRSTFQDRGAVLPGAVMVDTDGTYHAWVIAFGDPPGTQDVHHLSSPDAVTWTEAPDASLAGLSTGFGNPGALPTSVLQTDDGWVMYLVATLATEQQGWDIWRATAPGPDGPWTRGDEPVLRRGAAGSWDAGGLDFPSVIPTDDGFAMLYSAIPARESAEGSIGLATSADGVAWTKHDDASTTDRVFAESDPIIRPGLCGGFDDRAVHQPRVVVGPDGLFLAYAGYAGDINTRASVGFATSRDGGLTWGCQWPANALSVEELPTGDGIHTVNAFMRGERVSLLIEWLSDGGSDVWLAHLGPREP